MWKASHGRSRLWARDLALVFAGRCPIGHPVTQRREQRNALPACSANAQRHASRSLQQQSKARPPPLAIQQNGETRVGSTDSDRASRIPPRPPAASAHSSRSARKRCLVMRPQSSAPKCHRYAELADAAGKQLHGGPVVPCVVEPHVRSSQRRYCCDVATATLRPLGSVTSQGV